MSVTGLGSTTRRQNRLPSGKPRARVARQLLFAASILVVPVSALATMLSPAGSGFMPLLAVLLFTVAAALAALALRNGFPYEPIGACNLVTLTRVALASVFAVP